MALKSMLDQTLKKKELIERDYYQTLSRIEKFPKTTPFKEFLPDSSYRFKTYS